MTESIAILHHMARSGGTLISKCLGSMEDIALLSEVHPFATSGQFNPLDQANNWLGIDVLGELAALGKGNEVTWLDAIEIIHRCVSTQGRKLVVRDWSHLDFTGVPWVQPTYQTTTAQLLGTKFDIHQAYSVRHPIDQWLSLSKLGVIAGKLDVATYLKGYRAFAEVAVDDGFLRYEDFTAAPELGIQQLCEAMRLDYDPGFLSRWSSFTSITGDVSTEGGGRATGSDDITPLTRRRPEPELLAEFERSPDFQPSLALLGYEVLC
jgi:hypothetical protein